MSLCATITDIKARCFVYADIGFLLLKKNFFYMYIYLILFIFCLISFCSKGGLESPPTQLTSNIKMTWLLTDAQLANLHQKFRINECSSEDFRVDIAREMNISAAIVHNWFEHMRSQPTVENSTMKRQHFGIFVCMCVHTCTCVYAYIHVYVCIYLCACDMRVCVS